MNLLNISPLHLSRDVAKEVARGFELRNDADSFEALWEIANEARAVRKENLKSGELDREIDAAYDALEQVVERGNADKEGHRHITRQPIAGKKYVIFSDFHMSYFGHRQNFFGIQSGNRTLYSDTLDRYNSKGFTLIENGDVEELVIFEPSGSDALLRADLLKSDHFWAALNGHRSHTRLMQLGRVIESYETLYDQIAGTFLKDGRYFRTAGNHDQDLQQEPFLKLLQTKYPSLDQVYDYVLLDAGKEIHGKVEHVVRYVIGHGHQFDHSTNPRFGPRIGEALSECLGWAYNGPDRNWPWGEQVEGWATGRASYNNSLVSDDASAVLDLDDVIAPLLVGISGANLLGPLGAIAGLPVLMTELLHRPGFWEALFGNNIGWEHFEHKDVWQAVDQEVFKGKAWFKYRHLDELELRAQIEKRFPEDGRPSLVLGHSHEPRFEPTAVSGDVASVIPYYYNTGAAGRYGNLIWALEIVEGEATLVGWSRPGGSKQGAPERRVYDTQKGTGGNVLVASKTAVPLP